MIVKWFFCIIVLLAAFQTELSNGIDLNFSEEYTDDYDTQARYNYIRMFGGATWIFAKHLTCSNITSDTIGKCIDKVSSFSKYSIAALTISNSYLKTISKDTFSKAGRLNYLLFENTTIDSIEPSAFEGMKNLKGLHMSGANIPAPSQETFIGLPNLEGLDLSNNKLGKSLNGTPFANLHKLKTLSLDKNSIQEIDSNMFQNLTNLQVLFLRNNLIQKLDSNVFNHTKKLTKLLLSNNSIEEIEDGTFSKGLQVLDLSFNKLSTLKAEIFKDVSSKMELTDINLSNNNITFDISFLSHFPNLQIISLSNNAIKEFSDLEVPNTDIDISFNKVNRLSNVTFTGSRKFNISYNSLTEFNNLRGPHLQMLIMNNNKLTDNIKDGAFSEFPELKMLRLDSNNITALSNGVFNGLESLQALNISFNSLDKLNVSVFVPLKHLEMLFMNGNQMKTIDTKQLIANLPSLKFISLSHNPWTCESIIDSLNTLRSTNIEVIHYHNSNMRSTQVIPCTHEAEVPSEQNVNEQTSNEKNQNEQKQSKQKPSAEKMNGDLSTETSKVDKEQTKAPKINDSAESKKAQEDMSKQISGLKIAIIVILLALCVGLVAKFIISYRKKTRSDGAPFRNTYHPMESQELL